jgi:hypothetical protein
MTKWSTLFPGKALISRTIYEYQASAYLITAPPDAAFIRASMVGAGCQLAGAAFARVIVGCSPAEQFSLAIGAASGTTAAGGNTTLTRVTGSVVICRADGAESGVAGTAAGSIGDTKRDGSLVTNVSGIWSGGAAGSDDADPYPLGYGSAGLYYPGAGGGNQFRPAYPGGGGLINILAYQAEDDPGYQLFWTIAAAHGRATVEFFNRDPNLGL